MWQQLLTQIQEGNVKALARTISLVENEVPGYEELLTSLPVSSKKIIGITGPPGAGKSTLADALVAEITSRNKRAGILCVDPSSPFNMGAVLGDRIRMSEWYDHPNVFIRSLAARGSLGGLHPKIIELSDVMKAFPFDYIIVETVGVGQSEIEIAGLADTTVVVVVPEGGDEIQTMKAGLMEIADVFAVNKSDRPGADQYVKNLRLMLAPAFHKAVTEIGIVKTIATERKGITELFEMITKHQETAIVSSKKYWLLAEKAWHLLQQKRMAGISKQQLADQIMAASSATFNLYQFIQQF